MKSKIDIAPMMQKDFVMFCLLLTSNGIIQRDETVFIFAPQPEIYDYFIREYKELEHFFRDSKVVVGCLFESYPAPRNVFEVFIDELKKYGIEATLLIKRSATPRSIEYDKEEEEIDTIGTGD